MNPGSNGGVSWLYGSVIARGKVKESYRRGLITDVKKFTLKLPVVLDDGPIPQSVSCMACTSCWQLRCEQHVIVISSFSDRV